MYSALYPDYYSRPIYPWNIGYGTAAGGGRYPSNNSTGKLGSLILIIFLIFKLFKCKSIDHDHGFDGNNDNLLLILIIFFLLSTLGCGFGYGDAAGVQ